MAQRRSPRCLIAPLRIVLVSVLACVLGGCDIFLNETFVYDVPAPVVEAPDAADAEW